VYYVGGEKNKVKKERFVWEESDNNIQVTFSTAPWCDLYTYHSSPAHNREETRGITPRETFIPRHFPVILPTSSNARRKDDLPGSGITSMEGRGSKGTYPESCLGGGRTDPVVVDIVVSSIGVTSPMHGRTTYSLRRYQRGGGMRHGTTFKPFLGVRDKDRERKGREVYLVLP
jgi:hypothetical protein